MEGKVVTPICCGPVVTYSVSKAIFKIIIILNMALDTESVTIEHRKWLLGSNGHVNSNVT